MNRGRWLRRIGIAIAIVALIAVAADWIVDAVAVERVREILEARLQTAGLEVRFVGDLEIDIVPIPGIVARDISISRRVEDGDPRDPLVSEIGELRLVVARRPLLDRRIVLSAVELGDATAYFDEDEAESADREPPPEPDRDIRQLRFAIRRVAGKNIRLVRRDRAGQLESVARIDRGTLRQADAESRAAVEIAGSFEGLPIEVVGETGRIVDWIAPQAPVPLDLSVSAEGGRASIEGFVANPLALSGVDLHATVDLDLERLAADVPAASVLPSAWLEAGSLELRANIVDPEGPWAVADLEGGWRSGDSSISLQGSIADVFAMAGVSVALRLQAEGPALLEALEAPDTWSIQSLLLETELHDHEQGLSVTTTGTLAATSGTLEFAGRTEIEAPAAAAGSSWWDGQDRLDIELSATTPNLVALGELFGLEWLPASLGPVLAKGTLHWGRGATGWGNGSLGMDGIEVRVGRRKSTWLEVDGRVEDLRQWQGWHLVAAFHLADWQHVRPLLDRTPPHVGPIRGKATLSDRNGTLGFEDVGLSGHSERLKIDISGDLDHFEALDGIEFDTRVTASDLGVIGDLVGIDLAGGGRFRFDGTVRGSSEALSARGAASIGPSSMRLTGKGSFVPGQRPEFELAVTSEHLVLGRAPHEEPRARDKRAPSWWTREESLELERLDRLDANIVVSADRISAPNARDLVGVHTTIRLEAGELDASTLASFEGGKVDVSVRSKVRGPEPVVEVDGVFRGIDMAQIPLPGIDEQSTGLIDAALRLESRGRTPKQLSANLSGDFGIAARDATFASAYGREFVRNVVRLSIPSFANFNRPPEIGCLVGELAIAAGVGTIDTLVLESDRVTVIGSGTIDFGRDAFDVLLVPRTKRPGVISVSAAVEVSGPLASPRFSPRIRSIPGHVIRGFLKSALAPSDLLFSQFRDTPGIGEICHGAPPPS